MLDRLEQAIGLRHPSPAAFVEYPINGWDCIFALVNNSMKVSASRLEIIGPKRFANSPEKLVGEAVFASQAERASKTHATVIATPDMDAVIANVRRANVRHWVQEPTEYVPFVRLWLGITEQDQLNYDPTADGGIRAEVLPSDSPAFRPSIFVDPAPVPTDAKPHDMIRIVSRAFLVENLDQTLQRLAEVLGWDAATVVEEEMRGYKVAHMTQNYKNGATLRLLQPIEGVSSATADSLERWGPGGFNDTNLGP